MTETMQWSTQRLKSGVYSGYSFAVAAAKRIQGLGHEAQAYRGPSSIQSPDDDDAETETIGHIRTTPEGKAAYRQWKQAVRSGR